MRLVRWSPMLKKAIRPDGDMRNPCSVTNCFRSGANFVMAGKMGGTLMASLLRWGLLMRSRG
eukprot:776908-Pleurochrysis_carterae.AAC.1